ncbi:MAG: hypothetical protein ACK54C_02090 [Betaproteobacteria bacterium]
MAVAGTRSFTGLMPRKTTDMLPAAAGQVASNAKFSQGVLDPWRAPATILALSSVGVVQTVYRFGQNNPNENQFWFEWTTDVNVVKGPVPGDTQERTYWTDGTFPKKTDATIATVAPPYPTNSYRLAVPGPGRAPFGAYTPSVSVGGTPTNANDPQTSAVYAVTYVTAWDEESQPSAVSSLVAFRPGQTVTVTLPTAPGGAYNINRVRIYRSNTGTSRTSFQFVDERPVGTVSYADTKASSALGEVMQTFDWIALPDNAIGLRYHGNEIMSAFFGNTLAFSEPGVPYAWPAKYYQAFDAPIVGTGSFQQSTFVGTTRGCFLVTGVDPGAMSVEQIKDAPSCVAKNSVVEMLGGVVWASADGLWYVGPGGMRSLTEDILTSDQWKTYTPASIKAYVYGSLYIASFNNGSPGTLIFDFDQKGASFTTSDQLFSAGYWERQRDALYVVQSNTSLRRWDAGAALTFTWRSKEFRFPMTKAMSCAKVEADAYPITFRLFADGVQRGSDITVSNARSFRLPAGRATTYSFLLTGSARVIGAFIAESPEELGQA